MNLSLIPQILKYFFLELAADFVVFSIFILVSYCLGIRLLKLFRFPKEEELNEVIFFSFTIGAGLLAFVTYILGHLHLLYSWLFWSLSLTILVLSRNNLHNVFKRIVSEWSFVGQKPSLITLLALVIILIHIFYGLTLVLLPEFNVDATAEHIAIGSLYKHHHKIIPIPFMLKGEWPHLTEMLHLFATMLRKSSPINDLINYSFYLSFLFGIYIIGRRFLEPRFALLGCAIFSVSSNVLMVHLLTGVKEDFPLNLFFLAAFLTLLKYIKSKESRDLALVVLSLGFAAGTKVIYGFIPLIAILALFIIVALYEKAFSLKGVALTSALVVALALLMALPWYARQIVYHHNPFYPMDPLHTFKTGDKSAMGSDPTATKENLLVFRHLLPENPDVVQLITGIIKGYILFLWRMTTQPDYFELTTISFSFIIILCFVLLTKHPYPTEAVYTCILASLLYTLYFFSLGTTRRFLPMLGVLSIVCAYIVQNININRKQLGHFLLAVVFIVLSNDVINKFARIKPFGGIESFWPVLVGIETRRERLIKETWGSTLTSEFIEDNLPKNAKLFFYPMACGYHFNKDYVWGDKLQAGDYIGYSKMKGPRDLLARLKELGITHMVVDKGYWPPRLHYREDEIHKWVTDIMQEYSYFMFKDRNLSLYKLQSCILDLGKPPTRTITASEGGIVNEEVSNKVIYEIDVTNYSTDYEYEIEALLRSMDPVEIKNNDYGQLSMKGPDDEDFKTIAQWNPLMIGGVGFNNGTLVRAQIKPSIKSNGKYHFKWTYMHGPAPIKMFSPKVNVNVYEVDK